LIFLLLFNPFVLNWSSAVMKESMHIFFFVLLFFLMMKKRYYSFIVITLILFFDRPYSILYCSILPLFFYPIKKFLNLKIISLGIATIFIFDQIFDLRGLLNIYTGLQSRLYESRSSSSMFTLDNPLINFVKVFLSPLPLRSFTYQSNFFYELHFIYTFFFAFILLRSIRFNYLPTFILIFFNVFLFPHEPRQKLTYLLPLFIILYHVYKTQSLNILKPLQK
jgi:hypothetical protein